MIHTLLRGMQFLQQGQRLYRLFLLLSCGELLSIVIKSTEEKTEEDAEDYSIVDTDTMRLYLLDDGKLCFTSADSMDDAEETEEAADSEDSEDSMDSIDWTVKVFFDKLEKK